MISEQERRDESQKRIKTLWLWNGIGIIGFVIAALTSTRIVASASQRAVEENKKADLAIAKTKNAETKLAELNKELEVTSKRLDTSNGQLLTITQKAISQGSVTADQVTATLDSNQTVSIVATPVCFVKYHEDPESFKLATSAVVILRKHNWVAEISKANYKGPRKRTSLKAQIRYSDPADKDAALRAQEFLTKEGIPTFTYQVLEPGGQKGIFRLWILH